MVLSFVGGAAAPALSRALTLAAAARTAEGPASSGPPGPQLADRLVGGGLARADLGPAGPGHEGADVVGPLEAGRVGHARPAHAAPQLGHRVVLVLGHDRSQLLLDHGDMLGAVAQ